MLMSARIRSGVIAALLVCLIGLSLTPASAQEADTFTTPDGARLQTLSPDGLMVATTDNGGRSLCVFSVPDAEQVSCADLNDPLIRIDPDTIAWSPDGESLLFAERIAQYLVDGDIWHIDVASGDLTNLTDDGIYESLPLFDDELEEPFLLDFSPAWSPDGSMIAFSRTVVSGGDEPSPTSMMLLDPETGDATELALFEEETPFAMPFNLEWSPSGEVIFASAWFTDPDDERNGVWVFDAASGEFAQLAGPEAYFDGASPIVMAVSPAGGKLVLSYPAYIGEITAPDRRSGYALLNVEDGTVEPIEPADDYAGDYSVVVGPNFSPDGSALVFGVRQPTEDAGFVIARDLESGDEQVLAEFEPGVFPITTFPTLSTPIQVAGSIALVLTDLTTAVLVELPTDLTENVQSDTPIATPEPATDDVVASPELDADDSEASPQPETSDVPLVVTIAGNAAVLREGPSSDDDIIAIVQPGTTMTALGNPFESDGHFWIEVTVDETGDSGFVRTDFLEPVG